MFTTYQLVIRISRISQPSTVCNVLGGEGDFDQLDDVGAFSCRHRFSNIGPFHFFMRGNAACPTIEGWDIIVNLQKTFLRVVASRQ